MSATYFWYQDKLVVLERRLVATDFQQAALHKYRYCPCVDGFEGGNSLQSSLRYGHWAVNDKVRDWPALWQPGFVCDFPVEFRAHLLLLGVS